MKISKQLVASLKETTGAGLNACYRALKVADGSIEAAIEELKKAGQKLAATKADRPTHQGQIITRISENGQKAVILKITCETDFVANNDTFKDFSDSLAEQAIKNNAKTIETLLSIIMENGQSIEQTRQSLVARLGENVQIEQFEYFETDYHLGSYVHKGRYGAVVELKGNKPELAKELAIHTVVSQSSDIAVLLKQEFYADSSQTVEQYLTRQNAEVVRYVLFKL